MHGWSVVQGRLTFANGREVGDVYQEVDGFYVVTFDDRGGCWGAHDLIAIGQLLDAMNEPWKDEIERYFDGD